MNKELIKQLAQKAGAIPIHGQPKNRALVGLDNIEKLVELVVRECADIARVNTRVDSKVYLMIREHFGVEE
jgi:hypothetical protein